MIPYTSHYISMADKAAVWSALNSNWIAGNGPIGKQLEAELCDLSGARHAITVSSGTAALHVAYLACGVGPGKTVVTSPVSFVATANAALYCGAEVAFVDIEGQFGCVERHWHHTDVYGVFVPVTLGGMPIEPGWHTENTVVDACHGPITHDSAAKATCISLHPAKHAAAGEGGAILTNDKGIAVRCRALRDHGWLGYGPRQMELLGYNYRLSDVNAALALSQLERYEWSVGQRRRIAAQYDEVFRRKVEVVPHSPQSARHLYQILVDDRDHVRDELEAKGVGTQVHYDPPIHLQPYYKQRFGYESGMFPNAERYAARTLSIPLYPTMTDDEVEQVINAVLEVV